MPKVRPVAEIADKWGRVTPDRAPEYERGVKDPLEDWEKNTGAAESTYESGVTEAIRRKAFGKGVAKAGTDKWQRKAIETGVPRFGPGVIAAKDDYEDGVAPYLAEIEKVTLPPRYPKGDPRNIARVAAIAKALHDKKIKG